MTPERFQHVERLYHAARRKTAEERAALLAEADPDIRREVESLLAQRATEFLDRPVLQNAPELLEDSRLTGLVVGASLGPYRIESKLGEGGMGVVYRAVDRRLRRVVAVKVLPRAFEQDPDRLRRFTNEARAASALNHPHILTVHDIGEADGAPFIAMEFIDGITVRARLRQGPLPLGEALNVAIQTGLALNAAHEKGIVHRDLKPENVMIRRDGYVKVVDFGLAALRPSLPGGPSAISGSAFEPTVGGGGTPAYMAPEQVDGRAADVRSDMFSFGVLVCELTTGVNPFAKSSLLETWSAISRTPESAAEVVADLPRNLARLITRLLAMHPDDRYPDMGQVLADLRGVQVTLNGGALAPTDARSSASQTSWKVPWRTAVPAAALVLALAGYVYIYRDVHRTPKLTDKDTIILADFTNKTGDPVFDDTLRQGLAVELQQSPFLNLISDARIRQTLALMGQPKETRLTSEIAQQICERTSSTAILEGSIANLGSRYVLGLRATNCNTGSVLDQEQIQADKQEDVLNSLSHIARKFRTRIGEFLATVEKHSTPLVEATTSSLEALKAYSAAVKVDDLSAGSAASIPLYRRAVEIDPDFALAQAMLGLEYTNMGEWALARESTRKAWQLRNRVSDWEKFFITFTYDRQVTGNLEEAFQTLELWAQTYPRGTDPDPQALMAGLSATGTGRFERAIEQARKSIAANPNFVFGYSNLAIGYFFLDRFAEAEDTLQRASARKLEIPDFLGYRYNIAVLNGDRERMDQVIALAKGKREAEHWVANSQSLALARSGRLQLARRLSSRALDLARQEGQREAAATYQAASAVWKALYGNGREARTDALAALVLSNGRDVEYAAGLALAVSGDLSRSQALADDLEKRFPEDTFARFTYVPVLHAISALHRGRPKESIEQLQIALPHELAVNGLDFHLYLGGLHSAYIRGGAFLAAHRYAEAAAEFQKIVDHRGLAGTDPIGALARLQLARAFALSGDEASAKAAYQSFLTLWKDADPDIQILRQARGEYGRLR